MLEKTIDCLPGVGPARERALSRLGLQTIGDVLHAYPRTYRDYTTVVDAGDAFENQTALFKGRLSNIHERLLEGNRRLVKAVLQGEHGALNLSWFLAMRGRGSTFLRRRLIRCQELWVFGCVTRGPAGLSVTGGDWYVRRPPVLLLPVYPLTQGISNDQRIGWADQALKYAAEAEDVIPDSHRPYGWTKSQALRAIHFPESEEERIKGRSFLVFEEFLLFQLGMLQGLDRTKSVSHGPDGPLVRAYLASLPFSLTSGQQSAIRSIGEAMESPHRMRCLLQGDVGCGKTVVAEYAAVKAVESGGQVALMVPTEILARQMVERFELSLGPLGISVICLVGGMGRKTRDAALERLVHNRYQVVVGTHALLNDEVRFKRLTLAVVDEQHRFGVSQRTTLGRKGEADILVMSATPIPRSLALTLYSNLDIVLIPDLPRDRLPVDTRIIHPNRREDVYRFLVKRVREGEQGFVVFPLVEESDSLGLRAAVKEMESLSRGPLGSVRVGLVHGRMGREKDDVMARFAQGELDVLVSTTVIEVGMDMPRTTVMVVEEAQQFGLAQLHQLRGRVGRSTRKSYCFLVAGSASETAWNRLRVIRDTTDGLRIAEEDLRQRGPGDFFGSRQSGEPVFRLADITADQELLEAASRAVQSLYKADPRLGKHRQLAAAAAKQSLTVE